MDQICLVLEYIMRQYFSSSANAVDENEKENLMEVSRYTVNMTCRVQHQLQLYISKYKFSPIEKEHIQLAEGHYKI